MSDFGFFTYLFNEPFLAAVLGALLAAFCLLLFLRLHRAFTAKPSPPPDALHDRR